MSADLGDFMSWEMLMAAEARDGKALCAIGLGTACLLGFYFYFFSEFVLTFVFDQKRLKGREGAEKNV